MEVVLMILIQYIRENGHDATNEMIAKKMIEHLYELKDLSLEQIASLCACSPSTFTRFLRTVGFHNYRMLMKLLSQPQLVYHQEGFNQTNYLNAVLDNLKMMNEMMTTSLLDELVLDIYNAKRIVLLSFPTNQSFTLDFQCKMILAKKKVEVIPLVKLRTEVKQISKDDLVFLISFKGNYNDFLTLEDIKKNGGKIIMLTQNKEAKAKEYCDKVIQCGYSCQYGEETYPFIFFLDGLYQHYYHFIHQTI